MSRKIKYIVHGIDKNGKEKSIIMRAEDEEFAVMYANELYKSIKFKWAETLY